MPDNLRDTIVTALRDGLRDSQQPKPTPTAVESAWHRAVLDRLNGASTPTPFDR